ncbi:helix-turn-helix domain-containing protein [Caballeronia novacaledonica]|uniref:Helix-turn-helix domain-containing protein n=1 Tax=Caballeronia novacaledonica TaxID=1544861 RepID=A0AA37IBT9_9BURK|nr:helix-turn-helix domain-containing protein [Caballeronia novacaledonica]GJH26995.1 helix-turn-helix domain-containing protein [Caballeronia novacaledonica]
MLKPSTDWQSSDVAGDDRTDAWQEILSGSYREWQVPQRLPATFYAHLRRHDFAGAEIVETVCDPCVGERTKRQVRRDDDLFIGVQLTTSGRERFKIGGNGVEVSSGDLVVWTSDQEVKFEVMERLHKVTLMIPWSLMRERLPERKQPPTGGRIESRTGVGSLLAVHLLALSNEIASLDSSVQGSVSRSTLELLGIALSGQQQASTFDASAVMLQKVQDFILQHLHEDELTPARIADGCGISLRYLHMLFQRSEMTVSGFVLHSRLQACKQALSDPAYNRFQISEIAYRWGFNSTSHFCRAFKEKFGESPGEVRRAAITS